ncbi:GNAT family N-acetyltransferase [Arthrobacter sp. Sa2BUA2]|uniref:GNAT family N-acetyltransferase n=1 Tax=Arthrobacter pullicola TaxID=2762224 RepID=A0ABR8YGZ6_9MICC|nr:GNAT family N-acetyltransferase [Arthrobacter pullicola]MBD8043489.1 GNAT family N-acetyltransferase [Arthrobacter pullicola]
MAIRRLTQASPAEITALAATLAEAFENYPWTCWTVDSERHEARLAAIQRLYLEHVGLPYGEVWTDDRLECAAVLVQPGPIELDPGLQKKLSELHGEAGHRLQTRLPQPPPAAWTLATIGVAPDIQGNGLGSALLEAMLQHADAYGRRIALETSSDRNLAFYRRRSFVVWAVTEMPDGGPMVWSMIREPVSGAAA